jgi:2-dehydropantoate 2-reductase
MNRYAILGPGGVGGFLAAALWRAGHETLVVAQHSTAELINRRGIDIQSLRLGDFTATPPAVPTLEQPVDVLFVTTKAGSLDASLERIQTEPRLVVPLLNGLDHIATLRRRFGADRVAAATIRIEADRTAPGQITQTSPFVLIEFAYDGPNVETRERLVPVADSLCHADVDARVGASEATVMWSKLVRLNALASTTAAADRQIGFIRSDPAWLQALVDVIAETAATATADGAPTDPSTALAELEAAHATLGSSMQRDLRAGRAPELDAIQGSVLRAAKRHGIPTPTITRLAAEIAALAGIDPPRV